MTTNPMAQDRTRLPSPALVTAGAASAARDAVFEIADAAQAGNADAAVARILRQVVTDPCLFEGRRYAGSSETYTRHLIHAGEGFSVLAVVWLPGQMSPIHGHRSWCVLGLRQGTLVETCFTRDGVTPGLRLDACRQLQPGMVSHSDGNEDHYHRVANVGVETAVSIHVYGVAFDRLGHGLNRMWEE